MLLCMCLQLSWVSGAKKMHGVTQMDGEYSDSKNYSNVW